MVLAQKMLSEKEYGDWRKEYEEAATAMVNREASVIKVV